MLFLSIIAEALNRAGDLGSDLKGFVYQSWMHLSSENINLTLSYCMTEMLFCLMMSFIMIKVTCLNLLHIGFERIMYIWSKSSKANMDKEVIMEIVMYSLGLFYCLSFEEQERILGFSLPHINHSMWFILCIAKHFNILQSWKQHQHASIHFWECFILEQPWGNWLVTQISNYEDFRTIYFWCIFGLFQHLNLSDVQGI